MTTNATTPDLPVVVVGAGPVGLAAAARLHERGLPFVVLEAGDHAGAVADGKHPGSLASTSGSPVADDTHRSVVVPCLE